jgi:hypothetical protein
MTPMVLRANRPNSWLSIGLVQNIQSEWLDFQEKWVKIDCQNASFLSRVWCNFEIDGFKAILVDV